MVNGDAAEQVVRLSLEGAEVALRITGSLTKNGLAALYALLSSHEKTAGQTRMAALLKSGKELKLFTIRADELEKFKEVAKQYGVLYTVMRDKENTDPHAEIDLWARLEDAPKINRIIEKYGFGTVAEVAEVSMADVPEQAAPDAPDATVADKDALVNELLGDSEEAPERGSGTDELLDDLMGKEEKQADPLAPAPESEYGGPSVKHLEASISDRPSVREELTSIKKELAEKQESFAEKALNAIEKISEMKEEVSK